MNELIKDFNYQGRQVRTVVKDGEPWFVAKDVCDILELGNSSEAITKLDEEEKGSEKVDTLGGTQEMRTINESGLYTLIIRSNMPNAKPFRKWVTSEVIPSIRKTGSYSVQNLSQIQILQQAVNILAEQDRQIKAIEGSLIAIKGAVICEPDNWRKDINKKLNSIAQKIGQNEYQKVRSESYQLLQDRAGVNLDRRLSNFKVRLFDAGKSQTTVKAANKLDIICEDKKLMEIYGKIVSEYYIKYVA